MEEVQNNEDTPRERLHKIVDIVDDDKVNAMLTLLQSMNEEDSLTYSDEFIAEPDKDYDEYLNGGKTYSRKEVEKHTTQLIKS